MTKRVFLIDVTRHLGPMQPVVQAARAHAESFSPSKVMWFHSANQAFEKSDGEEQILSPAESPLSLITKRISDLAQDGEAGSTFHVISYDGPTLREAAALNSSGVRVNTQNLAAVRRAKATTAFKTRIQPILKQDTIPLPDAAELTRAILTDLGHKSSDSPLLQNRLRFLLASRDPRARKNPLSFHSRALIGQIVSLGIKEGWLGTGLMNGAPGTEAIWLIEQSGTKIKDDTVPLRSEAAIRAEAKTASIIDYLKSASLYAPKDIRDLILQQLLLINPLDITVTKLFRSASKMAQEKAIANSTSFAHWRPATESVTNLAIKAGVLIDGTGRVIPDSFTSRGTIVGKIDIDLVDACDRFLMVAVIGGVPGLTSRDAPSIAHALFKEAPNKISQDDMIDRVHDVLSQLAGKLDQSSNGVLTVI